METPGIEDTSHANIKQTDKQSIYPQCKKQYNDRRVFRRTLGLKGEVVLTDFYGPEQGRARGYGRITREILDSWLPLVG